MEIKPVVNSFLFEQLKKEIENGKWIEDREKLCIAHETKWTIAHEQARRGWKTEDKEILKLTDEFGYTVAHIQAEQGWTTEDKEILMLATEDGLTVAHEQANHGWITTDPEILSLTNKYGNTVYETILSYWNYFAPESDILKNYNLLLTVIEKGKKLIKKENSETLTLKLN
ncbi:MAG: hypothetical protein QXP34_03480 [Candidatus Aenigmatarchaeota archaeon]